MRAFFALLGVFFKNLVLTTANFSRSGKKKAKAVTGVGALVFLGVLMLYISGTYSFMLAAQFAPLGGLDIMLALMLALSLVFPTIMTLYASQGTVFSTKDVDLVFSLPVSAFSVMLARVFALYLEALFMLELMLVPAGVAWAAFGGAGGVGMVFELLVFGLFLALVPTTVSMVFGFLVSAVVSRMRFKNLFNILFSLLLVVGIMAVSFLMPRQMAMAEANIDGFRAMVASALPPVAFVAGALANYDVMRLLLAAVVCAAPFFLLAWLFSRVYKKILTGLQSHHLRQDYKLRGVRATGSFGALFNKEARRFFGTPAYVLNMGIMGMMMIVLGVAALVFRGAVNDVLAELFAGAGAEQIRGMVPVVALAVLAFALDVTCPACVSVSLEGKSLWILKAAPVSTRKIFMAKVLFSFLVSASATAAPGVMLGAALGMAPADVACITLVLLALAAFVSLSGLWVNLLFPRLDADNETLVIKQSASVILSMLWCLAGLVVAAAAFVPVLVLGGGFAVAALAAFAVLALLAVGMGALLLTRGQKLFAAL